MIRAIALISGGLDSALAARVVAEQGVAIIGLKFTSPFCTCDQGGKCYAKSVGLELGIPLRTISKGKDYLDIIRNPKFGYGKGINPCIDCRIYMLKKAWAIAEEIGASFLITGEVLDQRPMSQHYRALKIIEKETGLEGKILRPLSARYLPETEPEKRGWVKREKLLAIKGRSRKKQLRLAKEFGIDTFACAAGGCLLTQKPFARKLKDLFEHKKEVGWKDIMLLKYGRHFRYKNSKIIVGRNEVENSMLALLKGPDDYILEVPYHGSPITIFQGEKNDESLRVAASLTALYSSAEGEKVMVKYGTSTPLHSLIVKPMSKNEALRLNIALDDEDINRFIDQIEEGINA